MIQCKGKWISIKDELPPIGKKVLVSYNYQGKNPNDFEAGVVEAILNSDLEFELIDDHPVSLSHINHKDYLDKWLKVGAII